jgi:hypothetical protein
MPLKLLLDFNFMKKLLLLFILSSFFSYGQRTMFSGQNNYVAPVTPVAPATLITTDLLLYIDADSPASYPGNGNGNTLYDLSSNLNHGTLSTNSIANTSSTPKKFTFNGTSGNNISFDPAKFNVSYTGKTVMFTAKMDANFGTNLFRGLFGSSSPQRNFNFYVYQNGSGYQLHFSSYNAAGNVGGGWLSDVIQLVTEQWYVFAFTQDANSVRFFVNGQLVSTTTGTAILPYQTTPDERLGATDNYWKGDINMVLIYKRGLSDSEILQNFNAVKSRFGL